MKRALMLVAGGLSLIGSAGAQPGVLKAKLPGFPRKFETPTRKSGRANRGV
jgi:hypothetical protein